MICRFCEFSRAGPAFSPWSENHMTVCIANVVQNLKKRTADPLQSLSREGDVPSLAAQLLGPKCHSRCVDAKKEKNYGEKINLNSCQ